MNAEQVVSSALHVALCPPHMSQAEHIVAALRAALADPESRDEVLRSLGMEEGRTTLMHTDQCSHWDEGGVCNCVVSQPLYRLAEPAPDRTEVLDVYQARPYSGRRGIGDVD